MDLIKRASKHIVEFRPGRKKKKKKSASKEKRARVNVPARTNFPETIIKTLSSEIRKGFAGGGGHTPEAIRHLRDGHTGTTATTTTSP